MYTGPAVNPVLTTMVVAVSLFGAILLGRRLRSLLPTDHLSSDSKDAVKLAMGMVATMTALLLGLLVSSAKGTYDTQRNQLAQMAAKVMFLDRLLSLYGPETAGVREQLRGAVAEMIRQVWPEETTRPGQVTLDERAGDAIYVAFAQLSPRDDVQRGLKTQALGVLADIAQLRTLVVAQSVPSISPPLLVAVVCWLVVIFVSFAVLAPSNATTSLALAAAALSVVGAVFLILELDAPLGGVIRLSSAPMVNAQQHIAQ